MGLLLKDRKELLRIAFPDVFLNDYFCIIEIAGKACIWSFELDCPIDSFKPKSAVNKFYECKKGERLTHWALNFDSGNDNINVTRLIIKNNKAGKNGETLNLEEIFTLYGGYDEDT